MSNKYYLQTTMSTAWCPPLVDDTVYGLVGAPINPLKWCPWHHGNSLDDSRGNCCCCGGPLSVDQPEQQSYSARVIYHIGNDQVVGWDYVQSTKGG
jgi:hypothetical protein